MIRRLECQRMSGRIFAILALLGASACADVMKFLVPPASFKAESRASASTAEVVLDGVRLADEATPVQVAIRAGRVVAIGVDIARAHVDGTTRRISLGGQILQPSFTDAHVHLAGAAMLADAVFVRAGDFSGLHDAKARLTKEVGRRGSSLGPHDWLWLLGLDNAQMRALDAEARERQFPAVAL